MVSRSSLPYGLGHIPDPAGHMVSSARLLVGDTPPPKKASVIDWTPAIGDQLDTSMCTGWATARGIATSRSFALKKKLPLPSPQGIYALARLVDRSSPKEKLVDEGAMPNQVMRAMTEWGCPAFDAWPFDPSTVNAEPTALQLEAASAFKLDGYYRVSSMLRFKQAIADGYAVPFAIQVDDAVFNFKVGATLSAPKGTIYGGHYICLVEYEEYGNPKAPSTAVTFANSWSTTWGDAGFGRGDDSFFNASTDRYAMNVHEVSP